MMCETCRELRDRIRDLEFDLGERHAADVRYALARVLKVTPGAATILARLYAAKGGHVSTYKLLDATASPGRDDDRHPNTVSVRICQLRRALGRECIETHYGQGYRLSDLGMARVAETVESERPRKAA